MAGRTKNHRRIRSNINQRGRLTTRELEAISLRAFNYLFYILLLGRLILMSKYGNKPQRA